MPLLLALPHLSYGLYNLAGGLPVTYEISFEGSIVIANTYTAQTNQNSSFTFTFTVFLNDETEKLGEQILNWQISPLSQGSYPSLLPRFWDSVWNSATNELAYSLLIPSGHILTIRKDGSRSPVGTFLESLLPVVNLSNRTRVQEYAFDYTNHLRKTKNVQISLVGWDFFGQNPPEDIDLISFFIGGDRIISRIYKQYEEKNKSKKPALFWLQNTKIFSSTPFQTKKQVLNLVGVYQIDLERVLLESASALGEIELSVPVLTDNSASAWTIHLNGTFLLGEKQ